MHTPLCHGRTLCRCGNDCFDIDHSQLTKIVNTGGRQALGAWSQAGFPAQQIDQAPDALPAPD